MSRLENIYQSDLPHRAIVVYMYLSDRAGQEGQCFPSVPTIARQTHLAQNTKLDLSTSLSASGLTALLPPTSIR